MFVNSVLALVARITMPYLDNVLIIMEIMFRLDFFSICEICSVETSYVTLKFADRYICG